MTYLADLLLGSEYPGVHIPRREQLLQAFDGLAFEWQAWTNLLIQIELTDSVAQHVPKEGIPSLPVGHLDTEQMVQVMPEVQEPELHFQIQLLQVVPEGAPCTGISAQGPVGVPQGESLLDGLFDCHPGVVTDDGSESSQVGRELCLKEALHVGAALGSLLHLGLPGTENIFFQGPGYSLC